MPQINQLSSTDQVQSGDQIPIYSQANGDARKASLALLKTFFQEGVTASDDKITQYAAPGATGFSIQISNGAIWLVLTPTDGFAAGTLVLPSVDNCADHQEILVNCTQSVAALTVSGNGSTVIGAPTSLAANGFFRLRFDDITDTWYRVG